MSAKRGQGAAAGGQVRVCARFRPPNAIEVEQGSHNVVDYKSDDCLAINGGDDLGSHTFNFDRVFRTDVTQADVFEYGALPIVRDVLDGYNGTIFAYGQTGSGKTHTMEGPSHEDPEQCGIIPRMIFSIFDGIAHGDVEVEYQVMVSYIEIYMERVRDLLNPVNDNLSVREDKRRGVYIQDVTEPYAMSAEDVFHYFRNLI